MSISKSGRMTDAQWAASMAIAALEEGRYRLAHALTSLAHRAQLQQDVEQSTPPNGAVMVPMAGPTRDEHARWGGAGEAPFATSAGSDTQILTALSEHMADVAAIPLQRCQFTFWDSSIQANSECRMGIRPLSLQGSSSDVGWAHIDPALEKDHQAVPRAVSS